MPQLVDERLKKYGYGITILKIFSFYFFFFHFSFFFLFSFFFFGALEKLAKKPRVSWKSPKRNEGTF